MSLIVNGVCRFTVNGNMSGRPWANILDMRMDTTGTITDRNDAIRDQAGAIVNSWCDTILTQQCNSSTFSSVSFVDLDNADGLVGSVTSGADETLPQVGSVTGDPLPASTSALITKSIPRRRGHRTGRLYLSGLAEIQQLAGSLTAGYQTSIQTAANDFLTRINQDNPGIFSYTSNLCVVHITERDADGNPTAGTSEDVTALALQQRLATQRRRQRK